MTSVAAAAREPAAASLGGRFLRAGPCEDFTGAVYRVGPFCEYRLHADTLPMFGAMSSALAHQVTGG